ncbi:MAG TPA: TolC family protein [Bacteroidia bacterium]|nr:TolC family protein [Bacteroidia bacterium]HNT80475.1 TolC family protein [Bacteroidia bacterium]
MKTKLLFLMTLTLGFPLLGTSQNNNSFSFAQAIEYALQHNPQLNNSNLDIRIAEKQVTEFLAIGLPQINASFDGAYNIEVPTNFLPDFLTPAIYGVLFSENLVQQKDIGSDALFPVQFGATHTGFAGINASQLLFDGSYLVGLKATKTFVELAKRNHEVTQNDIKVAVAQTYYAVLIMEEHLELLKKNKERIQVLLDNAKAMNESGFIEKIEVDRIKISYNKLSLEQSKLERMLPITESALKLNMGLSVKDEIVLTDKINSDLMSKISTADANDDISNRPEYKRIITQITLAEYDLKRFRMAYLPRLELYGTLSTTMANNDDWFFDPSNKWFPSSGAGLRASLPIFTSLQRKSRTDMARLRLQQAQNGKFLMENSMQTEMNKAKVDLQSAIENFTIEEENKNLTEELVRVSKIKYEQGVGSNLELISAETDYREALTSYYNAIYNSILARIAYEKSIGKLSF